MKQNIFPIHYGSNPHNESPYKMLVEIYRHIVNEEIGDGKNEVTNILRNSKIFGKNSFGDLETIDAIIYCIESLNFNEAIEIIGKCRGGRGGGAAVRATAITLLSLLDIINREYHEINKHWFSHEKMNFHLFIYKEKSWMKVSLTDFLNFQGTKSIQRENFDRIFVING